MTMITKEEFTDLLPFYAMDAVTDEERRLVEEYLSAHPEAREELSTYTTGVEALAESIEPMQPTDAVKDNLMTWVNNSPKSSSVTPPPTPQALPKRAWWSNLIAPALAGSMALAAFALIWGFSLLGQNNRLTTGQAQLEQSFTDLQAEVVELETDLSDTRSQLSVLETELSEAQADNEVLINQNRSLQEELDQQELDYASFTDPSVKSFNVGGTEAREEAFARFVVNETEMTAFLSVANLEPLADDMTYQFWLIDENGPISAGIFTVDDNGQAVYELNVDDIGAVAAVGVSIEPAGGSDQPTGDIVLLGEL